MQEYNNLKIGGWIEEKLKIDNGLYEADNLPTNMTSKAEKVCCAYNSGETYPW